MRLRQSPQSRASGDPDSLAQADDPKLVAALLAGAEEAPRILWLRYAPMVFRILRRTLDPGDGIEDLAQEVFLRVFEKAHEVRDPQALKAFIISVTILTGRSELRRRWVRRRAPLPDETSGAGRETASRDADARQALLRFYRILGQLRATDRAALTLRLIEALDLTEVAAALDVSLATAKRRLARGWAKAVLLIERDPFLVQYRSNLVSEGKREDALP